jgi:hypothetical protein
LKDLGLNGHSDDVDQYVLIGLWRPDPFEMLCYRQFIVINPVVLLKRARFEDKRKTGKVENLHMKEFLHKSHDGKELYYFHL